MVGILDDQEFLDGTERLMEPSGVFFNRDTIWLYFSQGSCNVFEATELARLSA